MRSPAPGAVYRLDPVLRASFQRLPLRADLPPGTTDAAFFLDGERLAPADAPFAWTLQPGPHQLVVRARDAAGRPIASAPVLFHVHGQHAGTASPSPLSPSSR